ncbi:MAG TPA: hypothetical protein VJV05_06905 [Pyrinomonadaceae bacterium]|nr:hypothetical protein [Pyrinomonadaceae bacterium]
MNSVPEHIAEEVDAAKATQTDRRRGMRLILCDPSKARSRFRIDVEDALLTSDNASPVSGRNSTPGDLPQRDQNPTTAPVVLLAVMAGLVIGFFVGRRRDR